MLPCRPATTTRSRRRGERASSTPAPPCDPRGGPRGRDRSPAPRLPEPAAVLLGTGPAPHGRAPSRRGLPAHRLPARRRSPAGRRRPDAVRTGRRGRHPLQSFELDGRCRLPGAGTAADRLRAETARRHLHQPLSRTPHLAHHRGAEFSGLFRPSEPCAACARPDRRARPRVDGAERCGPACPRPDCSTTTPAMAVPASSSKATTPRARWCCRRCARAPAAIPCR